MSESTYQNIQKEKTRQWITSIYFASLTTTAQTNAQYLNTTVAWAISLMTGGLAFIFSRSSFPDEPSVVTLVFLIVALGHFFVRACKGYTNMMRFTTLEKLIVDAVINDSLSATTADLIRLYHVNWRSPLCRSSIIFKALTELGFASDLAPAI